MTRSDACARTSFSVEVDASGFAADRVLSRLHAVHPVLDIGEQGRPRIRVTVPGEDLTQATSIALTLVGAAFNAEPVTCEVLTEDEFIAQGGYVPADTLLSLNEAAEVLGVEAEHVTHYLIKHRVAHYTVDGALVVPRDALGV